MSVNRGALSATPLLLRATSRSYRPLPLPLSRRHPSVAILIPALRFYSSEPSTSQQGSGGSFPPPGFNSEQAKKPLRSESQSKDAASTDAKGAHSSSALSQGASSTSDENAKDAKSATSASALEDTKSLDNLAAERAAFEKQAEKKKEETKKLTIWQKVKKEAAHYWDGTKLLAAETRISFKLALKMAAGYELTRREHRQVGLVMLSPSESAAHIYSVPTYRPGSRPSHSFLCLRPCPVRGASPSYRSASLPQPPPKYL